MSGSPYDRHRELRCQVLMKNMSGLLRQLQRAIACVESLGVSLANHNHQWTADQRRAWEGADRTLRQMAEEAASWLKEDAAVPLENIRYFDEEVVKLIEERDEARAIVRQILDWLDGMGMRPEWEKQNPWLLPQKTEVNPK